MLAPLSANVKLRDDDYILVPRDFAARSSRVVRKL